jgi:MSHA biogenesis protein MshP
VRISVTNSRLQRGFSLVSAIFLLVVLAVLGAAMTNFSTTQNQGLALDVMGSRAYQAAQTGIEWAAYSIASNPGVAVPATVLNGLGGNLNDFAVTVGYTAVSAPAAAEEGSDVVSGVVWSYDITSTATRGAPGTPDYVERVMRAKM